MASRFILIEDSETGLDASRADLFDDEERGVLARDDANRDAEEHGVPVLYRLFALTEVGA